MITLEKHGGLAAGIRRPARVVDSDTLPKASAEELGRLVAALKAAPAAVEEGPGRARDVMSYTITVEDCGRATVIEQSDTTMTPEFAALMNWLEKHSPEW